jgi:hypothetical protein
MIRFEDITVAGLEVAVKAMRNPLNSWDKSDSHYECGMFVIGENDLSLMRKLYKGGTEHRKFMRQVYVAVTITAPLYWWKQMDQFKVGTTTDSCSTMHAIHKRDLTLEDFAYDGLDEHGMKALRLYIDLLNGYREGYNVTKKKVYWDCLIKLLPECYMQKRTLTMNYEVAVNIIRQRRGHKLSEWEEMIKMLTCLPYLKEIMDE